MSKFKSPALYQLPNTEGYQSCFRAPKGYKFLYTDINAAEPHVAAYYSRDENMLQIYQVGKPANCIYAFYGHSSPAYHDKVAEGGYDPLNPTPAGIKHFKIHHPDERSQCKTIVLGQLYGMGAGLLQTRVELQGFQYSYEESKAAVRAFRNTFPGIDTFKHRLLKQWRDNGGWIKCGRGTPITLRKPFSVWSPKLNKYVKIDDTKDIVNRFVQRTAHKALERMLVILNQERIDKEIRMYPVHSDKHDATFWCCDERDVDAGTEAMRYMYERINEELQWDVAIKGVIKTGDTFSDFLD